MNRVITIALACVAFMASSVSAQVFTSSPSPLQESSKNVVLTFHADASKNTAIKNLPASTELYIYTGVKTNKKNDWTHVKEDWSKPTDATKLTYVSPNTYTITLGDLRTYYNLTDPTEHITQLCLIAKTKTGSPQTEDCFLDVAQEGFAMHFGHDRSSTIITNPLGYTFTLTTTSDAKLTISVNDKEVATGNGKSLEYKLNASTKGSYKVVGTAVSGNQTLSKTYWVLYASESTAANYPGGVPKMGPVNNADGSVTFCVAAPNKKLMVLMGSWDDYATSPASVMNYQDYNGYRYFWATVRNLDPDTDYIYFFNVDGTQNVCDPYGRITLDPYNDKWLPADVYPDRPQYPYDRFDGIMLSAYRRNFAPYTWKTTNYKTPAHDQLTIYEMLFRDFTGTEGRKDANGTIRKAMDKIDYLAQLGVNAVELMPVMEFGGNNSWGYNTNAYFSLDKAYGSPTEFKAFVDMCHLNGIAVILDIVLNHSDGLHPWYQMYPISSNPFYNANCPHGWGVLNDWKQENPLVQKQWEDVLAFWIKEYKVDGYRFDLVKGLGTSYGSTDGYNESRIPVMKRLHQNIRAAKADGIHINEFLGDYNEEIQYCNDGQLNWNNQNGNSQAWAKGAGTPNLQYFSATACSRPWGTTVGYIESHDEQRVGYVAAKQGSQACKTDEKFRMQNLGSLAAQMLMTPGPQMIWQFGELGDEQNNITSSGNDVDPKYVNWGYLNNENRKGLHDTYTEILNLRKKNPELFGQNSTVALASGSSTASRYTHLVSGNKEAVLVFNPNASSWADCYFTPQKMNASNYQLISCSNGITKPALKSGNNGQVYASIPPRCYAVFASKAVSGVEDVLAEGSASQVKVYGGFGQIIINGDYTNAQVYSLDGKAMGSLNVPAGVYIVTVDNKAHKVLVK